MKRAIILVIDSMGVGAMPDCRDYNDVFECNTLKNVAEFNQGLNLPNMQKLGLGNIQDFRGIPRVSNPIGQYAMMAEKSIGKDTTTGHWEMAGLVLDKPFQTYPKGFENDIIHKFLEKTGCEAVLGNYPASGTQIIEDLNEKHQKTKYPIVYTSADSVFQIACDIDLIPLETLYKWCEISREFLDDGYNISRVIARPYRIVDGKPTRISKDRRDFAVAPYKPTLLNEIQNAGGEVIGIGKIEDIFCKSGITHAIHTASNREGLDLTLKAVKGELNLEEIKIAQVANPTKSLIFTNLVDTDMLYGHRNDAKGYGLALEEIDVTIAAIINNLKDEDLLIITADHGCDPTVEGTDHTREYVPLLVYHNNIVPEDLNLLIGFDYVAQIVKDWLT